jgi:type I restriction enzyme S subunit
MSLNFKYIPLTFLTDESEIKKQICNTIILRYFFDKNNTTVKLNDLIEGTQYGYNASALESGNNKFLRISDITNGKVDWETVPFCNCDDEETYLLYPDDILIARTGGTTGKSFLISSPPEHSIYAGYLIRIRANSETKPEFLKLFLDSYAYWSQIVSMNEDEFRPSVNANKLKQLLLPKCEPSEQEIAIKISLGEVISGYEDLSIQIDKAINEYENCKRIQEHCLIQKSNTEFLKQSILQEAIQGKLTERWRKQNPNIEPASELLKRIKAEKAQLIKDKKIRKEKPLPPITEDEIPFELPEGWVWCRLGEVFQTTSGGTPNRSNSKYWNGSITWYKSGELNDGLLSVNSQEKITELGLKESSATLFPEGTLLIAMYGATAGKLAILGRDATTNQAVCGFYKNPLIESEYLFNFLMANRSKMISESWGMSQPNISQTYLKNFVFALPPLDEQNRIVEKVKDLMETVEQLKSEIAQSEHHAQILMQAVLKEAFESKKEEAHA